MGYSYKQSDGKVTLYRDQKKYLFPIVMALNFSIPFIVMWIYNQTQNAIWILFPLLYFFILIPLIDAVIGEDRTNPPEDVVPELSNDPYYRRILLVCVPAFYAVYFGGIWFIMSQPLPVWAKIAFALGMGLVNGNINTIGHELGHKLNKVDQVFARLAFIANGNGHFIAEHNKHHHTLVSTPQDTASSKMGETLYQFARREIPGAIRGALALETARLSNKNPGFWSQHNKVLMNWVGSLMIVCALIWIFGMAVLPFILVYKFTSFFILTLADYIEHYGLLRETLPNGKYEPCAPKHSWNTNYLFSNLATIHLQRHSDHHTNPMRPYQSLRTFDGLPTLPSGYPGCFGLALIPKLWFHVMDPKVIEWANGDLKKINRIEN